MWLSMGSHKFFDRKNFSITFAGIIKNISRCKEIPVYSIQPVLSQPDRKFLPTVSLKVE